MTTLHAILPDSSAGRAATAALADAGYTDDADARAEVHADRLYHTPHAGQAPLARWFLGGALLCGTVASAAAYVLASLGKLGVSVPPDAAAMFWFLAGSTMGGLSAALGGAGAFKSHYYTASRDLVVGQVLVTVEIPWDSVDDAERLLRDAGASSIHRHPA